MYRQTCLHQVNHEIALYGHSAPGIWAFADIGQFLQAKVLQIVWLMNCCGERAVRSGCCLCRPLGIMTLDRGSGVLRFTWTRTWGRA